MWLLGFWQQWRDRQSWRGPDPVGQLSPLHQGTQFPGDPRPSIVGVSHEAELRITKGLTLQFGAWYDLSISIVHASYPQR
jgi:hypothetical protein